MKVRRKFEEKEEQMTMNDRNEVFEADCCSRCVLKCFFSYEHQDDSANTVENDEQQQLRASIANSAGTCDFLPNS